MRKDERHQIKRNDLATVLEWTAEYVVSNLRRVTLIAVVLVAAFLGAFGVRSWLSSRAAAASFLVGEMIQIYRAPVTTSLEDLPPTGGIRSFGTPEERDARVLEYAGSILARYGRTAAAPKALYYKGLALTGLGRREEARAAFEELLHHHPRDFVAPLARLQLGRSLASSGRPEEALVHYLILADDTRGPFPREEGLLGAARCQEALGRKEEALKTYQRLLADFPDSEYQLEARRRLDELT
jgi:tetratricopeptide (TPR) repeat protein